MRTTLIWMALLAAAPLPAADYPQAEISNGQIHATLYLPDAKTGYYRGTRFDWSGVIASLTYKGHTYFGPWYDKTDPQVRDFEYRGPDIVAGPCSDTMGPAEEFSSGGAPLGFKEAAPGGTFVQIGVGVLRRPDAARYDHFRLYEIVDGGKWTVRKGADWIEFTQQVADAAGYGYVYRKTVRLVKDKPELLLEHSLKNTGKRSIDGNVYAHNFLVLDHQPPGPGLTVTFPFEVHAAAPPEKGLAEIRGNQIVYVKKLEGQDRVTATIQGFGASAKDYDIKLENAQIGAGMRITGDHPLERESLWSIRSNISVEPFIAIAAAPGKQMTWKLAYTFY